MITLRNNIKSNINQYKACFHENAIKFLEWYQLFFRLHYVKRKKSNTNMFETDNTVADVSRFLLYFIFFLIHNICYIFTNTDGNLKTSVVNCLRVWWEHSQYVLFYVLLFAMLIACLSYHLDHYAIVTSYGDMDLVNIGSGNFLLLDSTKPLPDPILTSSVRFSHM